jgi:hypothetical protein
MFHILNALFHGNSAPCPNLDDLLILLTLDIKNAFNTHSRQRIYDFFSKSCSSTGQNAETWSGWNILCIFADNTVFLGPQAQALAAADLFNTLLSAANFALNPIDSNILLTNLSSTLPVPTTMTTQNGLEFPCTKEGLKLLGSRFGTAMFCQEQFNKTYTKLNKITSCSRTSRIVTNA